MLPSKKRKISTSQLLLLCLEKSVQGGEFIFETSADLREWMYKVWNDYPRARDKYVISRAIKRLRERGLLEEEKKHEDRIILKLTEKGRDQVMLTRDNFLERDWDGKWRIVVFDIPESKRLVRDVFRNRLKGWGFIQLQKSVWVTKKNVIGSLRKFVKELGIDDWVIVFEARKID